MSAALSSYPSVVPGLFPLGAVPDRRPLAVASAALVVLAHAGAAFLIWALPGAPVLVPPEPLAVRLVEAPKPDVLPKPPPVTRQAREPVRTAPPTPVRRSVPAAFAASAPVPTLVADAPQQAADAPVPPAAPEPAAPARVDPVPAAAPHAASDASASRAPATEAAAPKLVAPRFDAAYLSNPPPAYPPLSRRLGEEGKVVLRVFVEPDGQPSQVEMRTSSGHARLDEAALGAVRRWRFVPARRGESPVAAWVLVPLNFTLNTF